MRTNESDELNWLAFRYISNEMTVAECDAFEKRLEDEQSAREAVACAVDLASAVASVPPDVIRLNIAAECTALSTPRPPLAAPAHSPRRIRAVSWIAAAAALVLGAIGVLFFKHASDESTLAKVWAKIGVGHDVFDAPDRELLADSDDAMFDDDADVTVPGWLIEAVGGESDSDKWEDS